MPLYDFVCGGGHRFERMVPLARIDEEQPCECGAASRRLISAPRTASSDEIEPIRGPDGKMHTSLASYRHSLTPGGNPQGERYIELGNEKLKTATREFDRGERREHIMQAIADVKYGRVPPLTVLED